MRSSNKPMTRGKKFQHFKQIRQGLFNRMWFAETDEAKARIVKDIADAEKKIKELNYELPEIKHGYILPLMKLHKKYKRKYCNETKNI